jgi:hypothetical protein
MAIRDNASPKPSVPLPETLTFSPNHSDFSAFSRLKLSRRGSFRCFDSRKSSPMASWRVLKVTRPLADPAPEKTHLSINAMVARAVQCLLNQTVVRNSWRSQSETAPMRSSSAPNLSRKSSPIEISRRCKFEKNRASTIPNRLTFTTERRCSTNGRQTILACMPASCNSSARLPFFLTSGRNAVRTACSFPENPHRRLDLTPANAHQ